MRKKLICMVLILTTVFQLGISMNIKAEVRAEELVWESHEGTTLHETDSNWRFLLGDYNKDGVQDIYALNRNRREVHILNGSDKYKSFELQTPMPLGGEKWDFAIGDYNKDGHKDLFAIVKSGGGSKKTEVHVLSGASNFQEFLIQVPTVLHETNDNWEFETGDYNKDGILDLYAFNKSSKDIHILNGADNFSSFLLQTSTPLGGGTWEFAVNDYNGDGHPDVYAFSKTKTSTGRTELHVLNGASNYKSFLFQGATPVEQSNNNWEFLVGPGKVNVYGVSKYGTGTKSTEIHQFVLKNTSTTPPSQDSVVERIVIEAKRHLGKPYQWGATGPNYFDCSGLTQYVYKRVTGIDISRTTYTQRYKGVSVSYSNLRVGDLVFTNNYDHVGIYVGNGQMIHAPQPGDVVKISNIYGFVEGRRIL